MPLFNVVGTTCMHDTFELGFAWVAGETEDNFMWCLNYLQKLAELHAVRVKLEAL